MTFIKPFQAIRPELDLITSPDMFFGEVKKNYSDFMRGGFFSRMGSESIYIYRIKAPKRYRTGVVCRMPVREYTEGNVIKHEHTLAAKEQKMMLLTLERGAMVKPVLLTYPEVPDIREFMDKYIANTEPAYEVFFEESQELHSFHPVTDGRDILALQSLFEQKVPRTYVADGHHRLATSAILQRQRKKSKSRRETYDYFLCSLFATDELDIHDYNRIVGFDNFSSMMLMALLSRKFNISAIKVPRRPAQKHEIVMAIGDEWYSLKWRSKVLKKYRSTVGLLDVNLLNKEVLANIFSVDDITMDRRVRYIEGPKGLEGIQEKIASANNLAAFVLPPVTWDEFIEIANSGATLPPKSTWFEPRMKNGVVVYGY